jgi:hypothetical protein
MIRPAIVFVSAGRSGKPAHRTQRDHPLTTRRSHDIRFAIAVEIAKPQIVDPDAGRIYNCQGRRTAIGDVPKVIMGIKDVCQVIPVEISDAEFTERRVALVDFLP